MRFALLSSIWLAAACASHDAVVLVEPLAPTDSLEELSERWHRSQLRVGVSTLTEMGFRVRAQRSGEGWLERRITASPGAFGEFEVTYSDVEDGFEIVFLLDSNMRYLWGEGVRDLLAPRDDRWIVGQSTADDVRVAMEGDGQEYTERGMGGTGHFELTGHSAGEPSVVFVFDWQARLCRTPHEPAH